jgi:hypothetical protein
MDIVTGMIMSMVILSQPPLKMGKKAHIIVVAI